MMIRWKRFFSTLILLSFLFTPLLVSAQQTQNNGEQSQNFSIYINGNSYPGSYFVTKHDLYVGLTSFENALGIPSNYNFPPQIEWQNSGKTYISLEGAAENLGMNLDINWGTGVVNLTNSNPSNSNNNSSGSSENSSQSSETGSLGGPINNYYNYYGTGGSLYNAYSSWNYALAPAPSFYSTAYLTVPGFNYTQCNNILSWQFWFAWECNPSTYGYYGNYTPGYDANYYNSYNDYAYQQPSVDVYVNSTSSSIISTDPAPQPAPILPPTASQPPVPGANPPLNQPVSRKITLPVHQRIFNNPNRSMPAFPSRPVFHPGPSSPVFHPGPSRPTFRPAPSRPTFRPAPSQKKKK